MKGNESVFPTTNRKHIVKNGDIDGNDIEVTALGQSGLTKREYFASMVMQGIVSVTGQLDMRDTYGTAAIRSVRMADALLEALEGESK